MTRKTLADRLQSGFNAVPLANDGTAARRAAVAAKPWVRRMNLWIGIGSLAFAAFVLLFLAGSGIGWNIWWNTKTSMVCTVTGTDSYKVYGKYRYDHTVYNVYTTTCGDLEVTQGAGRNDQQAIAFAQTLRTGATYEMDVRGWDGWMGASRAIAGVRPIGGN